MQYEVRQFKAAVRSESGKPPIITGFPITFSQWSADMGFREKIEPDACEFVPDLRADWDHDSKYILGSVQNNTLRMSKEATGWRMEAEPPDTSWARDLMVSIARQDIAGGSFAFQVKPGGQRWNPSGTERTLTAIRVSRVTVTSNPAYPTTAGFQVRSAKEILQDRIGTRDTDLRLRDLDLSLSGVPTRPAPSARRMYSPDLASRLRDLDRALVGPAITLKRSLSPDQFEREAQKLTKQIETDRRQLKLTALNVLSRVGWFDNDRFAA